MDNTYTLFFSWQSDRKDIKSIISKALARAKKELKEKDILLVIDQDTRNRTGKKKIEDEVLYKIDHCDIFLADLTPITTLKFPPEECKLPKHMPNSNVMFEYGYAQKSKGERRMIILASLNPKKDEHIEYMPFDINHDTITQFESVDDLKCLSKWIGNIIEDVNKERSTFIPKYSCKVLSWTEQEEISISPTYSKTLFYINNQQKEEFKPRYTKTKFGLLRSTQSTCVKRTYKSYENIPLKVFNLGSSALDNCKFRLSTDRTDVQFRDEIEETAYSGHRLLEYDDLIINENGATQYFETINPGDKVGVYDLYVLAPHDVGFFNLQWEVSTRQGKFSGTIKVNVNPQYHNETKASDSFEGEYINEWIEEV